MLSLPVCDVGFHAEQPVFDLTHGFICGYGDNVNGHHHIAVKLAKLRHHTVLDIRRIFTQENDTPISVAHTEVILFKLKGIGADKVLKIVTFTHCLFQVEMERRFFACAVEVVENAELFFRFKLYAF